MTTRHVVHRLVRRIDVWKFPARLWVAFAPIRAKWWRDDRPLKALSLLSPPAKALLRRYLKEDTKTLRVLTVPSAAIGLELADIVAIYRAPELSGTGDAFVLPINGWAWDHLRRHPELLDSELAPRRRGPWWWPWPALGAIALRARGG
jgi:hypothetical protein